MQAIPERVDVCTSSFFLFYMTTLSSHHFIVYLPLIIHFNTKRLCLKDNPEGCGPLL